MEQELQKWYEDQFDMFSRDGWKDFIEQVKQIQEGVRTIDGVKTAEQLHNRLGQKEVADWVLNWENSVNNVYKDLTDEANI